MGERLSSQLTESWGQCLQGSEKAKPLSGDGRGRGLGLLNCSVEEGLQGLLWCLAWV